MSRVPALCLHYYPKVGKVRYKLNFPPLIVQYVIFSQLYPSPEFKNLTYFVFPTLCNVSTLLKPILFADDTNLFYSGKDIDELCRVVSMELDKLCIWFQVNKLSLNTSKTNFMVFTNKSCDDTYSVCTNGLNLSRVFVTKFLGVHMDCKLDWNYHIDIVRNEVAKKCICYE